MNHSVHDHQLGAVNGLAQTVAALARAVGPAVGGFLWSLSAHLHIIYINYICAVAIFMVMQYLVHQLPHTIDHAKTHRRAGQHAQLQHGQSPVEEYESVATLLQAGADDDMQEFEYNAV